MSTFLFLFLLLMAARAQGGAGPLAAQAAHAQIEATVKKQQAKGSPNPAKHAEAAKAQKKADDLTQAAQREAVAKETPKPWPQAIPPGLPPFPGGWEYDNPPPQAVQNRAMQLLPVLWKTGPGSRKTEQTQGRWITYRAEKTAGNKSGVVAYRPKPGAIAPTPPKNIV